MPSSISIHLASVKARLAVRSLSRSRGAARVGVIGLRFVGRPIGGHLDSATGWAAGAWRVDSGAWPVPAQSRTTKRRDLGCS